MNTQREIIQKGYQALVDALGPMDAIRFIQHFSSGKGDYTQNVTDGLIRLLRKNSLPNSNKLKQRLPLKT